MIGVGKPKPGDQGGGDTGAPPEGGYEEESAESPPEEESEASTEGAYPEFTVPEGLDLSDLEPGEEKQVLCTISKTSDTEACIKQVDGVDLAGQGTGMYGPPPALPPGGPPPPPPGGGMPMPMGAPMGPGGPAAPVRRRAAASGLM